ncbi:nitroreductase [Erysipelotrichaceae bacterium RD49]|nr:nitroreductase [Erysipelotrichaceae bacterium RD49]
MNPIIQNMIERRSVRKFKPDLPAKEEIYQIIEAGLFAPTGRGLQSPRFIVISNPELIQKLSEQNRIIGGWPESVDPFYGAPVVIAVVADEEVPTHVYDGALAAGNMQNAAHALGLGSCWIHRAKQEFETPIGKSVLEQAGITEPVEGISFLILGYPEGEPAPAPVRKPNRVFYLD